jgi:hypothetical protein
MAAALGVAVTLAAPVAATADPPPSDPSWTASAALGAEPVWDGLSGWQLWPGNIQYRDGRHAWANNTYFYKDNTYQYFTVDADRVPVGATHALVGVTYWDQLQWYGLRVEYQKVGSDAWTNTPWTDYGNTAQWKQAQFVLADVDLAKPFRVYSHHTTTYPLIVDRVDVVLSSSADASGALGDPVSGDLGPAPVWDGMTGRLGEGFNDAEMNSDTAGGRQCWRGARLDGSSLYLNFVADQVPAAAKNASVEVSYFDEAFSPSNKGRFTLEYHSTGSTYERSDVVSLEGTNTWKTHEFRLEDIQFDRSGDGADFRIANWIASSNYTSPQNVCISAITVNFTNMWGLSVVNDSLIQTTGAAAVELQTTAEAVSWTLRGPAGEALRSGVSQAVENDAVVDLSDQGPGYYTIDLVANVDGAEHRVSTALGILDPLPKEAISEDSPFGVHTHFPWEFGSNPDWSAAALLPIARQLGIAHIRDETYWSAVETTQGEYSIPASSAYVAAALELGMDTLLEASFNNSLYDSGLTPSTPEGQAAFAAYASYIVGQLQPPALEVYNEFNGSFNNGVCGRTPACYLPLLKATAERVAEDHPGTKIVGPVTVQASVGWITELIELGGLDYLDVVSTHPYVHPSAPEGLIAPTAALKAVIAANTDDPENPEELWFSELGWPTHSGGVSQAAQADYLVRAMALSTLGGVGRVYWYDLLNDYQSDPEEMEANFGLVEGPAGGVYGYSPKPSAVALGVMARAVVGRPPVGEDAGLGVGVHSVVYSGDVPLRVLWAAGGSATVQFTASAGVTVTDVHGAVRDLKPGLVQVTLDGSPVYLEGSITGLGPVAAPAASIEMVPVPGLGDVVSVTATVDRTGSNADAVPGEVEFEVAGVSQTVSCAAGETAAVSFDLPLTASLGDLALAGYVSGQDGVAVGRVTAGATVVEPVVLRLLPKVDGVDPLVARAELLVTNNRSDRTVTVETASWDVGGTAGALAAPFVVPAGATSAVGSVDLSAASLWTAVAYSGSVTLAGGLEYAVSGSLEVGPVEADGVGVLAPIDLDAVGVWKPLNVTSRPPASDLGGVVSFAHAEDALVVEAVITDDVHHVGSDQSGMWSYDSLQVAVSPLAPGYSASSGYTELAIGELADGTPLAYAHAGPVAGRVDAASVTVTRDDAAGTTRYVARIPWSVFGLAGGPDHAFGLSLLVNENDGDGRDGYVEWGSGIGGAKNPGLYHTVSLVPAPAPAGLALSVSVSTKCMAGKAYLVVRSFNGSDVPVDLSVSTSYGSQVFAAVGVGGSGMQMFTTKKASYPSGQVSVSAAAGTGAAARSGAALAPYPAGGCVG